MAAAVAITVPGRCSSAAAAAVTTLGTTAGRRLGPLPFVRGGCGFSGCGGGGAATWDRELEPGVGGSSGSGACLSVLPPSRRPRDFATVLAAAACTATALGGIVAPSVRSEELDPPTEEEEAEAERRAVRAAIETGHWPPVEAWVRRRGLDSPVTPSGQSALSLAAEHGAVFLVRAVLQAAADPRLCDSQGLSVLLYATRGGHGPVVQELLGVQVAPDGPTDIFGNAPIHGAVGFGHVAVARMLLCARCSPDQRTGDIRAPPSYGAQTLHEGPLHLACRAKPPHLELRSRSLVLLLLRFAADPCQQDDRGDTAVHHLARKGDAGTIWALLSRTSPEQAVAAARGLRNARGATAFDEAVAVGAPVAARLALRCGALAAQLRQSLRLPVDEGREEEVDEAAQEARWKAYRAHLEGGSGLLSFEEGGDGVRRRGVG